ncbi:hypothetical protein BDN72DRAFT_830526 [Pluteus cervinus]|uniref:Uncharacterized protein n=1 Tax=Pluteus cervinus TaxID=181527 RepID=A0ACD3BGN7_9AGAR|nr:hypothetical protein BDN72DRAFT_830526 [Pluteus cervinus]
MADYIRRLVSGPKARFKDQALNMELDLVYVTDHIIIMGYPAIGVEGLYRNRREDAKRFLDHRHGENYWVFNFCPIKENSYPPSVFEGRVSRYPFPDHHAPPLALLPLVAREMRAWLDQSPDHVAVLHCKAGKGRSGTMACSYLLLRNEFDQPELLERNRSAREKARVRADQAIETIPEDAVVPTPPLEEMVPSGTPPQQSTIPGESSKQNPHELLTHPEALKKILDLHTSRRMRPSSPNAKVKQGVSIPSQRRWLHYWSLILAGEIPKGVWRSQSQEAVPKVKLSEVIVRMKNGGHLKKGIIRAAGLVLDPRGENSPQGKNGHVWVSLARYDDGLVSVLEKWEEETRHSESTSEEHETLRSRFEPESKWDNRKMVTGFSRFGGEGKTMTILKEEKESRVSYTLRPLSDESWVEIKRDIQQTGATQAAQREELHADANAVGIPTSETSSFYDVMKDMQAERHASGVLLDAGREVRMKLYMGTIFMGWAWFIPAFHIPAYSEGSTEVTRMRLSREDLDFPLGIGSDIIEVEIALEWSPQGHTQNITREPSTFSLL